jgi:hypothetical protein
VNGQYALFRAEGSPECPIESGCLRCGCHDHGPKLSALVLVSLTLGSHDDLWSISSSSILKAKSLSDVMCDVLDESGRRGKRRRPFTHPGEARSPSPARRTVPLSFTRAPRRRRAFTRSCGQRGLAPTRQPAANRAAPRQPPRSAKAIGCGSDVTDQHRDVVGTAVVERELDEPGAALPAGGAAREHGVHLLIGHVLVEPIGAK